MDYKLYIKDLVYGANDGIITTFAVVAGVVGAGLSSNIILIIGIASLIADGFSMAASDYLGSKSEEEMFGTEKVSMLTSPFLSACFTFFAFLGAGFIPLIPYIFSVGTNSFLSASVCTLFALFIVGALRAIATRRSFLAEGFEMVMIGGVAAGIAYFIGEFVSALV